MAVISNRLRAQARTPEQTAVAQDFSHAFEMTGQGLQ